MREQFAAAKADLPDPHPDDSEGAVFWRTYLADAPPLLNLMTDRPRAAHGSPHYATHAATLPTALGTAIATQCQAAGVPLLVGFLAAWHTLLYRYTGQADIVVGTPRTASDQGVPPMSLDDMVAVRGDLAGEPTFAQFVQRLQVSYQQACQHQDLPFTRVVALLGEASSAYPPIFQTALALREATDDPFTFAGLAYDIAVVVTPQGDEWQVDFHYDAHLFDAPTIARLAAHFARLLAGIGADAERALAAYPLLSAAEVTQQLTAWQAPTIAVPAVGLPALFEQQAARTPDAVAVIAADGQWTYAELNARANQLAWHLRENGAGLGQIIGVCLDRTRAMLVAILGILKTGAAYLPLDPVYPTDRLAYSLDDAGAAVLVTTAALRDAIPGTRYQRVELDALSEQLATLPTNNLPAIAPDQLAYVIYTSGSTGRPKGVAIAHHGAVTLVAWALTLYDPADLRGVLAATSICFDLSIFEFFVPLSCGGTVILADNALSLPTLAARAQVTLINTVPSAIREILALGGVPANVRVINLAGEPLAAELASQLYQRTGVQAVYNLYGPTEDTTYSTWHLVPRDATLPPAIGRPIANTQAYICDAAMQLVPAGAVGELYLGGAGLARGYLNRPELTAERFVRDPFSGQPGARLYKTGDLARYRPNGEIDYLGRIDHQVKVRGYRIELGEIESTLRDHPAVRECVALVREDVPGDQRIVAYVVLATPTPDTALRDHLQARLPRFMVPSAIVELPALPLTLNGKLDRRALPIPDHMTTDATAYVAPRTPLETQIAAIWAQVLHRDRVGVTDNFFHLGGHSLLATRALARVMAACAVRLPLSAFFAAPTVAEFAAQVEVARASAGRDQPPPISAAHVQGPQPLSYAQERLWFLEQLQPDSALYVVALAVRLPRVLTLPLLRQSVQAMVARHASLRTTFTTTPEGPRQVVADAVQVPISVVDLTALPAVERAAAIQQHAQREAQTPFDLTNGPLLRVVALTLDAQESIVILTQHHIISDGWSLEVLVRDLLATYDALQVGQDTHLPDLPIDYADYAQWQRQWLAGAVEREQLAYWTAHLSDVPTLLELPTDHPRPPVQSHRGARHAFTIEAALTEQLLALSHREGATLYMTLLAAFEVLLHRYTHQADFVVGTVVAGRQRPELEDLIGFFVNTLPLHAAITRDAAFQDFLARTRAVVLNAFAHQDVPFERIVEALHPERDLSYHPLIQALFVLQNTGLGALETAAGDPQAVELETGAAQFDLTLEVTETSAGLRASLQYNTDLFETATVARMAEHFICLLMGIVANPLQAVARLPLLSAAERQRLLVERNATDADFTHLPFIPQAVAAQAQRTPLALAVADDAGQLTYDALNRRANQLAHALIGLGVGPEVIVGVCLERSNDFLVALLAILKAGGAYLPIDQHHPAERRAYIAHDARIAVVITRPHFTADFALPPDHILFPDAAALRQQPETNPVSATQGEQLAYVIYTSGSTGQPKGVQITHNNLRNLNAWYQRDHVVTPTDRFSQMIGPSFDANIIEIWPALTSGASVHVVDEDTRRSPTALRDWLVAHQITIAMISTVMAEQVVRLDWPPDTRLRLAHTGGEALGVYPTPQFPAIFINEYGPTETTVLVASGRVPPRTDAAVPPSIGRPMPNTQLYLLDDLLQAVPDGVVGELYIGGAQVARGYLRRDDLTQQRFIPDPFRPEPGARLYKTGDLCRYRLNGELEYIGRTDEQVKLRGFRIELGEIAAALRDHPGITQALVLVREDVPGDKRLVAYVVPQPDAQVDATTLRAFLQARLPAYMLPAAFVTVAALPQTPNGKVDRQALPIPDQTAFAATEFVAPRTPLEGQLAAIWAEVLHLDRVSVTANFFALGGHSLLATRVISRLRNDLGMEVPLRTLFAAPTVAEMAQALTTQTPDFVSAPTTIPRAPRDQPLRLSSGQERLWFFDQLDPASALYLVPSAVRVQRPLDAPALVASLQMVVQRHEILRTTFAVTPDGPVQVIAPEVQVPLRIEDLRTLAPADQEAAVDRFIQQEAVTPLPLSQSPLLRGTVLWLSDAEMLVLLTQHHAITDGWSLEILLREWFTAYDALRSGAVVAWPALPIQYADYAQWQRDWTQSDACAAQLAFWQGRVADLPTILDLPTDHPRPALPSYRGAHHVVMLTGDVLARLQALSRQTDATLYVTLLAAFEVLLQRYTRQEALLVGTAVAGRTRAEVEDLLGFFVNTLPLPAHLTGDPDFVTLIQRTRQIVLAAQEQQDVPFDMLVELLHPTRDASHPPLVQVMVTYQEAWQDLPGIQMEPVVWQTHTAKFDLMLSLVQTSAGVQAAFEYNTDLFDASTIARMADHFLHLLAEVGQQPTRAISAFTLLDAAERQQTLVEWNATATDFPRDATIAALFEQIVAATPEAVAVVCGDDHLTYAALNARANQLAHHLRSLGIGPEVPVGLCIDRSLDLIISLVAILKAGGYYVPIDPTYPAERIAFMLADARIGVLLTQPASSLPPLDPVVRVIDDIGAVARPYPTTNLPAVGGSMDLAYVNYTSGTTGVPKGVCIPQQAVVRLVKANTFARLTAQEVFLQLATVAFDAATLEIWGPLLNGGRLVVAPAAAPSLEALGHLLMQQQITTLWLTAGLFHLMVEEQLASLRGVRQLLAGGDVLSVPHVQRVLRTHPTNTLINGYGPTEGTTFTCCYPMTDAAQVGQSVPIGRPIANTQVYLLDPAQQPVPVGVPGELYIGGAGLARDYLHRPDLTAERFVPHPFSAEPGARLYRTGDLVRYLADGTIEFLGRIDQQVKIRGYRIELGEIESVLGHHPAVRECVVSAREDVPGDKRLVAYLVLNDPAAMEAVQRHLQTHLPAYMVPSALVPLAALPLNASGKVDRRALPAPTQGTPTAAFVAPRTPLQVQLAAIWGDILHVERVGLTDDFFALGGHSLLATRLVSRLREALQVVIPLRVVFERSTLAALAEAVAPLTAQAAAATASIHQTSRGPQALTDLVGQLEQLSDEDIRALLAQEHASQ